MDPSPPLRDDGRSVLNRRRLLQLAGTAGLAAVAACSRESAARPTSFSQPPAAPPAVTPASRVVLCRDAWGANPPYAGGIPHDPVRMTIHHTAVHLGDNSNSPARLRQHQHYHQDTQGWIDIAYHLSVDRDGNIYELRRPELVGDTATNYDPTGHFLVVCEGNFDDEDVTEQQLNGAAIAFAWAAQLFDIPTDTLAGHRDVSPDTSCPGANLYAHLASDDLKNRVDDLLAAGPVDLHTICGPEASTIVADIEAGLR
ncbi:peptidoglycan recognition family protein [Mycobacterium sp. B14F4]|uniref:peptidoglycan recognition protein family protein n=1 Tax=Mycobacterium sp. B14F4 TaxID=3153565 RepID=UPI00325C86A7